VWRFHSWVRIAFRQAIHQLPCNRFHPAVRTAYDQLGCGFSDRPDDPSLCTVERFRDEVEQVRSALGLDRFVLYGQSWGGMLATEYTFEYPQFLTGLVISDMTASIESYVRYVNELRAAM